MADTSLLNRRTALAFPRNIRQLHPAIGIDAAGSARVPGKIATPAVWGVQLLTVTHGEMSGRNRHMNCCAPVRSRGPMCGWVGPWPERGETHTEYASTERTCEPDRSCPVAGTARGQDMAGCDIGVAVPHLPADGV
jgi:hypothetical protein